MDSTKGRASAANMRLGGKRESDEEANRRADREAAERAALVEKEKRRYKQGDASPTFKLEVPPQADDEIPVVLKKRRKVNQNKPSEPF